MLTIHHLNDSRSQRILWLLEELGLPYDMKRYQRDVRTRLAPHEVPRDVVFLDDLPKTTTGKIMRRALRD